MIPKHCHHFLPQMPLGCIWVHMYPYTYLNEPVMMSKPLGWDTHLSIVDSWVESLLQTLIWVARVWRRGLNPKRHLFIFCRNAALPVELLQQLDENGFTLNILNLLLEAMSDDNSLGQLIPLMLLWAACDNVAINLFNQIFIPEAISCL